MNLFVEMFNLVYSTSEHVHEHVETCSRSRHSFGSDGVSNFSFNLKYELKTFEMPGGGKGGRRHLMACNRIEIGNLLKNLAKSYLLFLAWTALNPPVYQSRSISIIY